MNHVYSRSILSGGRENYFHIDACLTSPDIDQTKAHAMYPYSSIDLVAIFFYGNNYQRQRNITFVPASVRLLGGLLTLVVVSGSIILWIIRRKLRLRHGSCMSTFIDAIVIFIAGGNLQMRHKFERWFFGISLIGAFFMTSLWSGDLLDCVYQTMDQKISTYDELTEIDAPIYIPPNFQKHSTEIYGMLRFGTCSEFMHIVQCSLTIVISCYSQA